MMRLPETVIAFPAVRGKRVEPPVNVLPMAACVKRQGIFTARVIDGESLNLNPKALAIEVTKNRAPIAGISVYTAGLPNALASLRASKELNPQLVGVLGGKGITHCYQDLLEYPEVDVAVLGEGEEVYPMILAAFLAGGVDGMESLRGKPGIALRGDTQVAFAPKVNIAKLPKLDWTLLQPSLSYYLEKPGAIVDMESARGCFGNCRFCIASRHLHGISFKDPDMFANELEELVTTHGHKGGVYLTDDNLLVSYRHLDAVLREMNTRNLRIPMEVNARADSLLKCYKKDNQILKRLIHAGIGTLHIGVESANLQMMERCNKGVSLEDIENAVELGAANGMTMVTNFIVGFPDDDEESILDSIAFAERLKAKGPHLCHVSIFMPYPDTEMYDDAVEAGLLDPRVFPLEKLADVHTGAVINTKYLTIKQINDLYNQFHDVIYTPAYFEQIKAQNPKALATAMYMAKKRIV